MSDASTTKRVYRSPFREQKAAQTRQLVVEAAADLFTAQGYEATTMNQIAKRARVSPESVYATGSKASLLVAALRIRFSGVDEEWPTLELPWVQEMFADASPAEIVDRMTDFLIVGHARSASLRIVVRTAASVDPLVAEAWEEHTAGVRAGFRETAHWFVELGLLPAGLSEDEVEVAAATLSVILSAESYVQLVEDWRFTEDQYRAWARGEIGRLAPSAS